MEKFSEAQERNPSFDWNAKNFDRLLSDAQRELYPRYIKYLLHFIITVLNMKVMNHMTNKVFNMILELFKNVVPVGEKVSSSLYRVMKILSAIGLGYEKIDMCKYDCAIFWKKNEREIKYHVCQESCWKKIDCKGNKTPHKVLWYFSLKPRL